MNTYIAILRGINVGGHHLIKMKELKALLEENGFHQVTTYIQSGNISFQYPPEETTSIAKKLSEVIAGQYGFPVPAIVLTSSDLKETLQNNPFLAKQEDVTKLLVTFLERAPDEEALRELSMISHPPDEFAVIDRAIYLHCPNGYGRTKLTNTVFEKKMGGILTTTRNWKTVNKLLEMCEQQG